MEDKQLNEQQSIQLIAQMIQNSQQRMAVNQGKPFVIWGYGVALTSVLIYLTVSLTGNHMWNFLWFLPTAVCMPIVMLSQRKCQHQAGVKSYLDRIVACIWSMFGIAGLIATIAMWLTFAVQTVATVPIFFIMALIMGMSTALSGLVIKYTPLVVCGSLTMLIAVVFIFVGGLDLYLVFAAVMIICMAIPGHLLSRKLRRSCCPN